MNLFENPYKGIEPQKLTRLQTYISKADHDFLFINLHPGHGSVGIVTNTLITKLITALKKYGITDHATQRIEFEQFITRFVIELPERPNISGSPVSGTMSKTSKHNDGGRVKNVRPKTTKSKGKSTDVQGSSSSSGGTGHDGAKT